MVERMTDGPAVVRSLVEHGVDVAFGIPGVRANSPAELEAAIAEASARNVPTIIDTPITVDVLTESGSRQDSRVSRES